MALAGTMNTTQKMPFTFAPDQQLDGVIEAEIQNGDVTVEWDDETHMSGFIVSGSTAGIDAVVQFSADGELGPGVSTVVEVATISIVAPNATTLGGVLGTPVPKDVSTLGTKSSKKK